VPAHALLSLRGLKYGDEWEPVWRFLREKHDFPGPLGVDEAVADIVAKLEEQQSILPGRVTPTVDELVRDAEQMGLGDEHLQQIQSLVGERTVPPRPDMPTCSSTNVAGGADGRATTVVGRFEIPAKLEDVAYATDPMTWPQCSWFFISMRKLAEPTSLPPPDAVGNTAYHCDLEELVGLENVLTVKTPLTTRYFVGPDSLGMEFDLTPGPGGDGKIDVDHGYLLAERHPGDPQKLIITSQKTFSFVGLDDLPFSFLCEFGWVDMMRAMAECRAPGGGMP
jgi:hypothetical protein